MKTIKLYTPVEIPVAGFTISHDTPTLFIGSCFAENMGQRMHRLHFPVLLNPFGILYNPLSMAEALRRCLDCQEIDETVLFFHDGMWHSWLHHGVFSRRDMDACLAACNAGIREAHAFLQSCRTMVFTFGSAWCYSTTYEDFNGIVANCHKVPANRFQLRLIGIEEMVEAWTPLLRRLLDKGMRIVLTVSPVRHNAYGAHGNQLGKAVLLLALERLFDELTPAVNGALAYFPAYEIVMDELRDYRFYSDDLLHPSPMAEEIVWQRFVSFCMTDETIAYCDNVEKQIRRAEHRPLHEML